MLTVEPKTAMSKMIQTGKMEAPKDDVAQEAFYDFARTLESKGFIHYNCRILAKNYFSKTTPLIGWEKNIWALDLRHTVIMEFPEVGTYPIT
jgi:coproporphyrinogen III oxidase-like Fe-S oxidoreductase